MNAKIKNSAQAHQLHNLHFHERSSRLELGQNDNRLIRYAQAQSKTESHSTRLLNISATGVGFLTTPDRAPRVGEHLKLEFEIPGLGPIAWFGEVMRVDVYQPLQWWERPERITSLKDLRIVGVRFTKLPLNFQERIEAALEQYQLRIEREAHFERLEQWSTFIKNYGKETLMIVLFMLLTAGGLYLLSLPSGNYTAARGAPWGARSFW